jgi:hypothetical protein
MHRKAIGFNAVRTRDNNHGKLNSMAMKYCQNATVVGV